MISFDNKLVTCFDVDDTIIPWSKSTQAEETIEILSDDGLKTETFQVLVKHIENLKRHKTRGHLIVVWSAGGGSWAKRVVAALKLEEHVDLIMNKPSWYYDDKPAETWMGKRIYLYKQPEEEEY